MENIGKSVLYILRNANKEQFRDSYKNGFGIVLPAKAGRILYRKKKISKGYVGEAYRLDKEQFRDSYKNGFGIVLPCNGKGGYFYRKKISKGCVGEAYRINKEQFRDSYKNGFGIVLPRNVEEGFFFLEIHPSIPLFPAFSKITIILYS